MNTLILLSRQHEMIERSLDSLRCISFNDEHIVSCAVEAKTVTEAYFISFMCKSRAVQEIYGKCIRASVRKESSISNEYKDESSEIYNFMDTVFKPDYK